METNKNHCFGCIIYNNECDIQEINSDGSCPCSQCLIKNMCKYSCKKYHLYRSFNIKKGANNGLGKDWSSLS
jgi:hypothetical protein